MLRLAVCCLLLCASSTVAGDFKIPSDDLAVRVLEQFPELADASNDWERVGILRSFAWANVDFIATADGRDNPLSVVTLYTKQQWHAQLAPAFFEHFRKNRGGVHACDCAMGFARLCEHFGYRAWRVSTYGPAPWQVIVEIKHRGKPLHVLECPTLNLRHVDRWTGEPLDYFELIRRLGRRQHQRIKVVQVDPDTMPRHPRTYVPVDWIAGRSADAVQGDAWSVDDGLYRVDILRDGDLCFMSPRTLDAYLRKRMFDPETAAPTKMKWFVDQGLPPNLLYAHLRPLTVTLKNLPDEAMDRRVWDAISLGEGERLELAGE